MPQLALYLLAGLTPPEHEVILVDENDDDVNLNIDCDLVGISCMTANAPRAYHFAQEFKKRGKTVVLGGVHPTILPDEALRYADTVVIGEAEGVWAQLLEDFVNGNLQRRYNMPYPSLDRYIPVKYQNKSKQRRFKIVPIMTTRGCPYNCEFCCVYDIYGSKIRHVPIENVVRSIVDSGSRWIGFLDDNIIGHPKYAKELFKAIKPLHIKWGGQASLSFVKDIELMRLAAESACRFLFFGVESVSEQQLGKMRKSIKKLNDIEDAIKRVNSLGIHFHASIVLGLDGDTNDIFPQTLEFLKKNKVGSVSLNVLTPYPGTKIYNQFKNENRLITDDWRYYDHCTVVYKPRNMTPIELQAGRLWISKEFTNIPQIIKRIPFDLTRALLTLIINLGYRQGCLDEIKNYPKLSAKISQLHEAASSNR